MNIIFAEIIIESMTDNGHILELFEFIKEIPQANFLNYNDTVLVIPIDCNMGKESTVNPFPIQLNACTLILVIAGQLSITVDYREYTAKENTLIFIIERHIVNNVSVSEDFRGYHIIVDNDFFKKSTNGEIPPAKGIIYNSRQNPLMLFDKTDYQWLLNNVEQLSYNIQRHNNNYRENMIINNIATFAYEIWNKTDHTDLIDEYKPYEELAMRFFDLAFNHCKEEHEVAYYANRLCVTPVLLSRAVKITMGKPSLSVLHDILLSEAKILMRERNMTIQQIADKLNFSDQASFSKFFKKCTGVSPSIFRKAN